MFWVLSGMFFEERGKVLRIVKAQAKRNLRNTPIRILQQVLCFQTNSFIYKLRCRFAYSLFQTMIKVVNMHKKLPGEITSRFIWYRLQGRVYRKLAVEQMHKALA